MLTSVGYTTGRLKVTFYVLEQSSVFFTPSPITHITSYLLAPWWPHVVALELVQPSPQDPGSPPTISHTSRLQNALHNQIGPKKFGLFYCRCFYGDLVGHP